MTLCWHLQYLYMKFLSKYRYWKPFNHCHYSYVGNRSLSNQWRQIQTVQGSDGSIYGGYGFNDSQSNTYESYGVILLVINWYNGVTHKTWSLKLVVVHNILLIQNHRYGFPTKVPHKLIKTKWFSYAHIHSVSLIACSVLLWSYSYI